jgi:hypothetical protein
VAPFVQHPRPPRTRRPRRETPVRVSAPRSAGTATRPAPPGDAPDSSRGRAPLRDRGSVLLIVFTSALLLMVGLVSLAAVVDRAWILIPVMAIDLTVTAGVLASVLKLMGNDDGE